ncbi:hypothetical protein M8818_003106 [Zalaria obscura]|uniref:Uncharacterized protein n=1 Tax=Zalaria obscura TaxID=2024903 RepID=A0ACC3SFY4_9PEZI
MAQQSSQFRTILECLGILVILYLLFGREEAGPSTSIPHAQDHSDHDDLPLSQEKIESLVYPDPNLQCPPHAAEIHIFSTSPLIIYIPNFLSEEESQHLLSISKDKWTASTIFNAGVEVTDSTIRKSEKAMIERDQVVQCLESRALSIQGWPADTFIERLWTQRYTGPDGHYAHHYDWASASRTSRRVSTFMVYVSSNCSGGGTNFPLLARPRDPRWCEWIDCSGADEGVTFLPRAGSAVFWENFDAEGRGWREGLHAGMPVREGTKVGLNIWSWYQKGHKVGEGRTEL